MRSRSRLLLCVLSVLAGLAALLVPTAASAARAGIQVRGWSAELSTSAGSVAVSPRLVLRGRPVAGRVVALQARTGTTWRVVDRDRTDARGRAQLTWTPPAAAGSATLRLRLGSWTSRARTVRVGSTPTGATPAPADDSFRAEVLTLTNTARSQARSCGDRAYPATAPLTRNAALDLAAQRFAEQMQAEDFFSHTGPDGSTMASRAEAAGYTNWRSLAENIARGHRSPQQVVDAWIASPGHCANLMSAQVSELGIGYAAGDRVWVQDFGRR